MGCLNSAESKTAADPAQKKGNEATAAQNQRHSTQPLSPGDTGTLVFGMPTPSVTGFDGTYNDTVIKPSQSVFSNRGMSTRSEGLLGVGTPSQQRRPTLTYTSSLCSRNPTFKMGHELLSMTWNIHHDSDCTPFDFYCDFRNLNLKERDAVSIEILWDVARVFFYPDAPSSVCSDILLKDLVPNFLLSEDTLLKYIKACDMDDNEKKEVMNYSSTSLHKFLMAHALQEDSRHKRHSSKSFIKTHLQNDQRKSSPLRPSYNKGSFSTLLEKNPAMLPVLILDALHVLVIQFSHFLIDNQLRKAFSEFEPDEQTDRLTLFLKQRQRESIDLALPEPFQATRTRLYERWKVVFENSNKIQQVHSKVNVSRSDIVLLQRVSRAAFAEIKNHSAFGNASEWTVIPDNFPDKETETTVMLLRKSSVTPSVTKIKTVGGKSFVIPCVTADTEHTISFLCAVASLTPGQGCGAIREKEARALSNFASTRTKNSLILGGLFNEDLTVFENKVSQILLKRMNGIDHTQEDPLAFSVNRTRTNLQFEIRKADKQDKGVQDGIFSTFPLVGEAYTDFQHSGQENPSDHGPVFQRILVQT